MTDVAAAKLPPLPDRVATARLLPITVIVFLGFSTIGVSLAALPLQVGGVLGYGPFVVGVTVALQSLATLATRAYAGKISDMRGGKLALLVGMASFVMAGLFYLLSGSVGDPPVSLALLVVGRVLAGFGESALVTGSLSWAIAAVGPAHTGRSMVWVGIAMFGAIGVGAPIGLALMNVGGFAAVALAAIAAPILGAAIGAVLTGVRGVAGARMPFHKVIGLIWRQGAGLALAAIGYGAMTAFTSLFFRARGWDGAGLALTAFGGAYILARLLVGHLPDKIGGKPVATVSAVGEVVGLSLMAVAATPSVAFVGAFFTGAGFSLIFPSLGSIAVHRVPASNRGAALGGYAAFLDIGIGVSGPLIGALVAGPGYPTAYGVAALAAALVILAARGGGK